MPPIAVKSSSMMIQPIISHSDEHIRSPSGFGKLQHNVSQISELSVLSI